MGKALQATVVALLVSLSLSVCHSQAGRGNLRIFFVGEVIAGNQAFLDWIRAEPFFLLTTVPCDLQWLSKQEARRFARMYLPRSLDRLREEQDVMFFEDFSPTVLPLSFLEWSMAAIEEGMGLALIEFAHWAGSNDIPIWMGLDFYGVFPADTALNIIPANMGRTYYRVEHQGGPVDLPRMESFPMNTAKHGDIRPRAGSVVEAAWRGRGMPAMVTSTYGKGPTLQLDHGWDNIPGGTRSSYEYLPDYIFNQVAFVGGIPLPEDFSLVHVTRTSFVAYSGRKRATLAVIDFVERFGADTTGVAGRLDSMDDQHQLAKQLYLQGEYQASGDQLFELLDEFTDLEADLLRARDRAFFWIYLAEWTAVVGVGMACGVTLWTLMVRRRLYRETSTTKHRGGG
jgi:hypothetical protein